MAKRRKATADKQHHWLTIVALACIILFGVTVVATNVIGWPNLIPGPLGYVAAILALCAGGFAFSLWEHVRLFARERRWPNFFGALIFFVGALAIDGVGAHSGIETLAKPWIEQMEAAASADQARGQRDLDARRDEIAAEIVTIRQRIADVPAPDMTGGPQNDAGELTRWNQQTAADRALLASRQAQIDRLPSSATRAAVAPWLTPAIIAFSIFAELVVAFGVSILGIEIAPQFAEDRAPRPPAPSQPKPAPAQPAATVTPISAARPKRQARGGDPSRWSGGADSWS